ncbi:MAG TPA: DUF6049 family protein [Marmoricola sp.]|nr:DUF6049 family protein [Marmoricola sp.]
MSLPRPTAAVVAALLTVVGFPFLAAAPSAAAEPAPAGGSAQWGAVRAQTDVPGAQAPLADEAERTPLTVRLLSMAPATVPQRGRIVLRGTVTNDSDETWQDINVLPIVSTSPITSRSDLAEQAATDESAEIAPRITDPSVFVSIGDLDPGQSRPFRIALPRAKLSISGAPGVYWIGAHALGTNTEGRDSFADGRVRTFIPLVPRGRQHTDVALVLPLRQEVARTLDGRVADADEWAQALSDDGRLGRLLDLAESAGPQPFTWLIDPAVLDAAADLAHGNPPLSLGEPRPEQPGGTPTPTPSGGAGTVRLAPAAEELTSNWLERLLATARAQAVLGLGYADPDVAALARLRPALLRQALRHSEERFTARDLDAELAAAPPEGWLDEEGLAGLDGVGTVLLSDHGHPQRRTVWASGTGATLVLGDELVAAGGPAPGDPLGALALRQRILSDAALRTLQGLDSPLVVALPSDWDPGPGWRSAGFFDGLRQRWLSLVALGGGDAADRPSYDRPLRYPAEARRQEIDRPNVTAALGLMGIGGLYDQLLDTTNDVRSRLVGAALAAVSYHARDGGEAADRVRARTITLRERAEQVHVELGTDFVTLSGGEGTLTVSLVNDLEQPVTVGVRATTSDSEVRIVAPDPVRVGPGERVAVRLRAEASRIGVHEVALSPVTVSGRAFGEPLTFNLRISQVGRLIWIIMIGVGALFFAAVVLRIVQRVRSHRRSA